VDDILDFTGTVKETGKPVGSDLRSGLITAPALHVLEAGGKPAMDLTRLIKERKVQSDEGIFEALELIRANGGVEAAQELAYRFGQEGKDALNVLTDSASKAALIQLVDYVLTRSN
jgi:geranylgeranyl pyrophosphate synthase